MRGLLVIWIVAGFALLTGALFAQHRLAMRMPDLFLVGLCVLALQAPSAWVPWHAACLALVRAPWTIASPVLGLAVYVVLAELLLVLRRAFVVRGPLPLAAIGMAAFGMQYLMLLVLPGAELAALPAPRDALFQGLLTGLLVPVLGGLVSGIPILRGALSPRRS